MASHGHALPGPPGPAPGEARAAREKAGPTPWSFAWFAGVDLDILAEVPSERTFYRRLGAGVLLVSCVSGLALSSALAYALDQSFLSMVWAGIAWTLLLACGVEPLVLQISPTKRRLVLSLGIAWRILFSVLLAFQLSEPLILRLNEPEINRQLDTEERNELADVINGSKATFNPTIDKDREKLKQLRESVANAKANTTAALQQRDEALESGACNASCGTSRRRVGEYREKEEAALGHQHEKEPLLEKELKKFQNSRGKHLDKGEETVRERAGIWARIGAMEAVASSSGAKQGEVWALRLLCLWLDLLPLSAKVYRIFTVESPYEMHLAAARREESMAVQAREAIAGVNEEMIREQARADTEVGRAEIHADTERRLTATGMGEGSGAVYPGASPTVSAWKLSGFVGQMKPHDDQPVPVPAELRRAGLAGALATGATTVLGSLWAALSGHGFGGLWLLVLAFAGIAALAAYTHGFRRAPAWALRAILATFIGGLLLPLGILISNVI